MLDPEDSAGIVDFRNMMADWLEHMGGTVPHRGYHTGTGEADLQVIAPSGKEIEITMRLVPRET